MSRSLCIRIAANELRDDWYDFGLECGRETGHLVDGLLSWANIGQL